jgi:hypothetical protein
VPIFYLHANAEGVTCPTAKIGAAKRAHYRKYGSDILAFGMMRYLSVPHLAISQQVPFFQEPMALWHAFCIVPRVERDQPLE